MRELPGRNSGKALPVCREQVPGEGKDLLSSPAIRCGINSFIDGGTLPDVVDDIHHPDLLTGRFHRSLRHG